MHQNEFDGVWERVKALWPGWATSIEGPHERFNFDVVYKMFRDLSTHAVNEAVDQHFAEKGSKKSSTFEPVFARILELAKFIHFAVRHADPMREIHQTYVSMLPRAVQLEKEIEWHRRMSMDDTVSQEERARHADVVILGNATLKRMNTFATQEAADKSAAMEAAQIDRANQWKRDAIADLQRSNPDESVREYTRPIPPALSRPSGARRRDSQSLGQVWK